MSLSRSIGSSFVRVWHGNVAVLRKAPNSVLIVCATVFGLALLASLTTLSLYGKSSNDVVSVLNTIMNLAGIALGGGALAYSASSAHSASNTEDFVSNGQLKDRIRSVLCEVLQNQQKDKSEGS